MALILVTKRNDFCVSEGPRSCWSIGRISALGEFVGPTDAWFRSWIFWPNSLATDFHVVFLGPQIWVACFGRDISEKFQGNGGWWIIIPFGQDVGFTFWNDFNSFCWNVFDCRGGREVWDLPLGMVSKCHLFLEKTNGEPPCKSATPWMTSSVVASFSCFALNWLIFFYSHEN